MIRRIFSCFFLFACAGFAFAQTSSDSSAVPRVRHGSKGFEFKTADNRFLLQFQSRLQFRFAVPADQDPRTFDDFQQDRRVIFKINRARLKIGGHAYRPWLKYYWEYELSQSNLLDFRIMIEKWEQLNFKIGQWKIEYTRERLISSGTQQMVDRSHINRPFTVDRQQGATVYGHLKGGGLADFNYWLAALTGNGRGATDNDDKHLMYHARLQWNFLGRELEFEGSDVERHEKPAGIVALAAVTNRSPYTRFSQAGGGELDGFPEGGPGQYRVNQAQLETAFMYRGFSWQEELHWKQIKDLPNATVTNMMGYYVQAGYFWHNLLHWAPPKLETAFRHALYRPDIDVRDNIETEFSLAFNYFFNGHHNKLTTEFTYFNFQDESLNQTGGLRFRIQYDISL
jgi:phosphate-selective porin